MTGELLLLTSKKEMGNPKMLKAKPLTGNLQMMVWASGKVVTSDDATARRNSFDNEV
jgi:hypothetical protein